jgi:putative PIN family toxin of toxin-antitoxin system
MNDQTRVVIDTNIWISYLVGQTLSGLTDQILNERIIILYSEELLAELVEVLHRQKFKKYFTSENIQELISLIDAKFEHVEVTKHIKACRDEKDNFLLDLCISGNADYLVTGDADLLVLNPFLQTEIIDYRSFEKVVTELKTE